MSFSLYKTLLSYTGVVNQSNDRNIYSIHGGGARVYNLKAKKYGIIVKKGIFKHVVDYDNDPEKGVVSEEVDSRYIVYVTYSKE